MFFVSAVVEETWTFDLREPKHKRIVRLIKHDTDNYEFYWNNSYLSIIAVNDG